MTIVLIFFQVELVGIVGGKTVQACTRNTLARIFTNKVAISFNWQGKGEKLSFRISALVAVVLS